MQADSKLTVESGSIYGIDSNGGSALYQYGGDIVVYGGHIEQRAEGTKNFAINAGGGTVTVDGGWIGGNHGAIATTAAVVVINDGTFVCTGSENMSDNVLYTSSSGSIEINGGKFIADSDAASGGCCVYDANGGATINGGNFSNSSGGDVWGTTGTTINGGTFENLIETSHVTVGATITNGGTTYTKTENGLEEVVITEVATYDELVAALANGGKIKLTADITAIGAVDGTNADIDLNGKTLTLKVGDNNFFGNSKVENGNISITSCVASGDCIIGIGDYSNSATLTFDNVNVTGDGYSSAYAVLYVYNSSEFNINGGSIVVSNDNASAGGVIKAHSAANGKINIVGTQEDPVELTFNNAKIGMLDGTVLMNYVDLDITGGANAINQSALTIKNSTLDIIGADGRALTLSQGNVVVENSTLNFSNCTEGEIRFKKSLELTADANSTITSCTIYADESATDAKINDVDVDATESSKAVVTVENGTTTVKDAPKGSITPIYTRDNGFWGEGSGNAKENLVVELYEGETKIATSTLNNIEGIIDGDVYVTWSIPFAGSTDDYWTVEWMEGYPKYDMNPTKGVMIIDGVAVAENTVQYNAPDNLNKIVAIAEGFTGGVVAYTTLTDAMGNFNGRKVNVLRDVTESIEKMNGATLTTNVEGGVTITSNYTNYIYANDLNIGKGVVVKSEKFFYETDGVNTIEGTLEVSEIFYHGHDAKTTITNGGNVKVSGTTILRYNETADAGIYIYGDNDDNTIEFDCDYYIGAYSGTFYAKNANIEAGYFLLKNSYDDSNNADINMTLDNTSLKVVGTTDGQDSFIIDDQAHLTLKNAASISDVRDFNILEGTNLDLDIDETSSISATNVTIAEDVPFTFEKNEDGTITFTKGLAGEGTEENPFLINNLEELILFRDEVNAGNDYDGKYVKLTADIDLASETNWTPIGVNGSHANKYTFRGYFDGNNKTISNLNITDETTAPADMLGLFGHVHGDGMNNTLEPSVKNLTLINVNISSTDANSRIGGLAGNPYTCYIKNVHVSGTISGGKWTGGLAGNCYALFEDCSFTGIVNSNNQAGGIAGAGDARVYNSKVVADITANYWAGGIVGNGQEGTSVVGCYVDGTIKANNNWYRGVGGIAGVGGHGYEGSTFENNYFDGEVYLGDEKVNAIVVGFVNVEDNANLKTNVEGNSWNTAYYSAETPVYVVGTGFASDATTDAWTNAAVEDKTTERNNNLVMLESDIQYIDATSAEDVTIMIFSEVTEDDILPQIEENNKVAFVDSNKNGTYDEGETKYESLQEAIEAVAENGTVTMLRDITLTEKVTVKSSMTLDLNGKTITTSGIVGSRVIVLNDQCVTFTVNANGGAINSDDAMALGIIDNESCADVTINDGIYNFDTDNGGLFKFRHNTGTFTLNNISVETNGQVSGPDGGSLQELVVNGGTFKAVNAYDARNVFAFYISATATFEKVTIENEYIGAIENAGGNVTVEDCSISVLGTNSAPYLSAAVAVSGGGEITINGGTYSTKPKAASDANGQGNTHGSWTAIIMSSGGTMTINDGTFTNGVYEGTPSKPRAVISVGADADYGDNVAADLVINGGTFNSIGALVDCETIWGSETDPANTYMPTMDVTITAGDFTGVAGKTIGGCDPISTGNPVDVEISGGTYAANNAIDNSYLKQYYIIVENTDGTFSVVEDQVAKIGDVTYKSLQEAFDAAQNDDEIVVLKDVTYTKTNGYVNGSYIDGLVYTGDKNFTVDFGGYTITENGDINDYLVYLNNKGENDNIITFKNGKIAINSESTTTAFAAITVGSSSATHKTTLNINDMKVVNGNPNDANNQVIRTRNGATVNLNDKTVVTSNGTSYGVVAQTNSTVNINNGAKVVQANSGTTGGNLVYTAVSGNGTINVYDGAIIESDKYGIHNLTSGNTVINIYGGTITAEVAAVHVATNGGTNESAVANISGGTFYGALETYTDAASIVIKGGTFSEDPSEYCYEGYAALPNLTDGYVVGAKPTATVNNLGRVTVSAGGYMVYGNGDNTADMPLSFVMQFLADQDAEDMATSPYADWYCDFVITFTGIENGSFTADGCYLAGHYGDYGWVKVPVDGMTIENGARYPVMLGVGMGQKYDHICSGVRDFKCALYLTEEILAANPNIKVNLELAIVDNSQGEEAAKSALVNNDNVYSVTDYTYDAIDFSTNVAKIGDQGYETLAKAVEAANANETITLLCNVEGSGIVINKNVTIDFGGFTYSFNEGVGSANTTTNGFQILKDNNVTLKNGTLNVAESAASTMGMIIQNYANLTITDMTLNGANLDKASYSYVLSNNSGEVNITGATNIYANAKEGHNGFAFDVYDYSSAGYDLPTVTVNTTGEIKGAIEVSATLKLEAIGTNNITNIEISGDGQLYHNVEGIQGTVKRTFENDGDNNPENDWYTIGVPFTEAHATTGLQTESDYALYRYDEVNALWENVKESSNNFTTLDLGRGYIYANAATTTDVEFKGTFNHESKSFKVTATDNELKGFNLIGNPFAHDITFAHLNHTSLAQGFYVLEGDGSWVARDNDGVIRSFQGALIQVGVGGNELTVNKEVAQSRSKGEDNGSLAINVSNSKYSDIAYVSFNEGLGLTKISHRNAEVPMVYVPVDGKNYAVATMNQDVTEIPVSFEAKTMGEYTISVEAQDCEFATMTLIDRLTGNEANLLLEDYTFIAKSNDNTERFVIRLATESMNSTIDNFAYISNNELYISCSSDNAVVEIYDVLGRPVASYDVNKSANISTENFTNGIYIIRLVEENDVKVQKILID